MHRLAGYLLLLISIVVANFGSMPSQAAEIEFVTQNVPQKYAGVPKLGNDGNKPVCNIRLVGEIVKGDFEKIVAAMKKYKLGGNNQKGLCLNSPGGSYGEAIRIAKAMLNKDGTGLAINSGEGAFSWWTVVEPDAKCLSACAVIFMAGNYYEVEESIGPTISRYLHVRGKLGFHSPYLSLAGDEDRTFDAKTVEKIFSLGAEAIRELARMGENVNTGGQLSNYNIMPQALIIEMLGRGSDEFFYIDMPKKAVRYRVELYGGAKPQKIGSCEVKNICDNIFNNDRNFSDFGSDTNNSLQRNQCTINVEQVKRGKFNYVYAGAYGGEGVYMCALRYPSDNVGKLSYYADLVLEKSEKLDEYGFLNIPFWYYYRPDSNIKSLGQ